MEGQYSGVDILEALESAYNYNDYLTRLIRESTESRDLIDFGAGIGTFSKRLRNAGYDVTCIEPDAAQRQRLEEQGFKTLENIAVLADNSASFIFSLNVFEHIHDDSVASIAEMDAKLAQTRAQKWRGKDLPFPVALDGGGETRIEGTDIMARGATVAEYGINSFPNAILIGKDGAVIRQFEVRSATDRKELLDLSRDSALGPAGYDAKTITAISQCLNCFARAFYKFWRLLAIMLDLLVHRLIQRDADAGRPLDDVEELAKRER